jgi:hypothetical protein
MIMNRLRLVALGVLSAALLMALARYFDTSIIKYVLGLAYGTYHDCLVSLLEVGVGFIILASGQGIGSGFPNDAGCIAYACFLLPVAIAKAFERRA